MLGSAPPPDLSALLSYAATALLVLSGFLVLLRSAASRYFAVESPFGAGEEFERSSRTEAAPMSMVEEAEAREPQCVVCGDVGTKHCAGCKAVRYCSLDCQSKHWKEEHKSKCKRKVSGSAIALIPGNGPPARAAVKVLRMPKKILFPYEDFVRLFYWDKHVFPPCGLLNCGNSCFANVVLQCLSFTRPLAAYLLEGIHSRECSRKSRNNDWCFLCDIQSHIQKVNSSLQPFSPMSILSGLTNINSSLGYGRQEDAHEFMRFAIDTMQSVCLDEYGGEKSLDASTQETTLVHHVFGGHLQSQVICTSCNQVSNRYENMMDLTVEIQGDAESLEDCLDQFTAKEWLDGENKYKCDGCNDYVKALKCLTVHQAPNILTIALKRFQSGRFGKLNKRVTFPETLDLGPYMSSTGVNSNLYSLYAIVVHLDMLNASFFGHYICYTKDFRGQWYRIDDCKVVMVDIEEVLAQGAYMLLYNRMEVRRTKTLEAVEAKAPLGQFSSNFPPSDKIEKMEDTNACATSNDGTLIEVETNMDVVDVPQPSSKVLALTHAADEDFSVVKLESIKEQNLLPIGISANGNNNSTYSLLPLDQSDESKPLEHEVGSSNDPQEPVVQIARSEGVEAGTTTCNLHPISPPGFLQLKQKRANSDVDSPCDAPSAPNLKNPATSPVSRGSSSSKESKPLFSRGFLDKPLKKKSLPLTRGARIERLTSSNGINGTSNGLCEPRQLDNETRKSDSQCSPRASNGSVKIATCSPRVSMGTNDHTEDGCSSEAIRCNGHLDANLSPFSHKKDVSTHTLALCTSVDEPHERHWTGNGFAEVDAVENRCASDANHENGSNSLPLEFMEGPTDIVLSENT